jgi:hypothetical protein
LPASSICCTQSSRQLSDRVRASLVYHLSAFLWHNLYSAWVYSQAWYQASWPAGSCLD